MDGSLLILLVVLVGFLALGVAALAGGVDSRELDPRLSPASGLVEGD